MTLLTYTTYSEVRAVLGVSTTELPDSTLEQPMYDLKVVLELENVATPIPAYYTAVGALTTRTADQTRFMDLVQLFAPHAIAKHLLGSLPMFAVQSLTDGRAGFNRNADSGIYDNLKTDVHAALDDIRMLLRKSYYTATAILEPSVTVVLPVLSVRSGRGFDPVTNI